MSEHLDHLLALHVGDTAITTAQAIANLMSRFEVTAGTVGPAIWLGASTALGSPVRVTDPYPHLCAVGVARRACAACAEGR